MSVPARVVILGGSGHARVLIDALKLRGDAVIVGILDTDSKLWKTEVLGFPVLGDDNLLPSLKVAGVSHFVVGIAGVGPPTIRVRVFDSACSHGFVPLAVLHPSAVISPFAILGAGVQVLPGAIVNACAKIGKGVIVNSGAIVEHDCVIGAHAHIACGARLAGGVVVESGAFIGAGATVIQCKRIGANSLVAAGAVIIRDVPPLARVGGIPASPLREEK